MLASLALWIGRYPVRFATIALALYFLTGCGSFARRSAAAIVPPSLAPVAEESADAKVRRLEGELHQAKLERDDARLAGARRLLNWSTGILALCAIGLVVAAIYLRSKAIALAALACFGGAAACQVFQRALDHIELISWLAFAVVVATGAWMAWRYHRD